MSGQQQQRPLGAAGGGTSAGSGGGGSGGAASLGRTGSQRGPALARTSASSHSRTGSLVGTASGTLDDASIAAAQELASIMNQPAAAPTSWLGAWPWAQALVAEDYDAPPPPLPPGTLPEVGAGAGWRVGWWTSGGLKRDRMCVRHPCACMPHLKGMRFGPAAQPLAASGSFGHSTAAACKQMRLDPHSTSTLAPHVTPPLGAPPPGRFLPTSPAA